MVLYAILAWRSRCSRDTSGPLLLFDFPAVERIHMSMISSYALPGKFGTLTGRCWDVSWSPSSGLRSFGGRGASAITRLNAESNASTPYVAACSMRSTLSAVAAPRGGADSCTKPAVLSMTRRYESINCRSREVNTLNSNRMQPMAQNTLTKSSPRVADAIGGAVGSPSRDLRTLPDWDADSGGRDCRSSLRWESGLGGPGAYPRWSPFAGGGASGRVPLGP